MIKKLFITLLVALFAFTAFAADKTKTNVIGDNVKKFVAAEKAKAPKISPEELKGWLDAKKDYVLLDVRTNPEVAAVKIYADKYAHFDRGVVEFYFTKKYKDPNQLIVAYCKSGARGAIVVNRLKELGYTNVYNLDGGIKAWMAKGYDVDNMMGTFKEVQF